MAWQRLNLIEREKQLKLALRSELESNGWDVHDDPNFAFIAEERSTGKLAGFAVLEGADAVTYFGVQDVAAWTRARQEQGVTIEPFIVTTEEIGESATQMAHQKGVGVVTSPIPPRVEESPEGDVTPAAGLDVVMKPVLDQVIATLAGTPILADGRLVIGDAEAPGVA